MVQCGHGLDPEGLLEKWEKEETERYFMESASEIVFSDDDSDQDYDQSKYLWISQFCHLFDNSLFKDFRLSFGEPRRAFQRNVKS